MGYELARFVNEIDDEFLCSICTMVLENPMVSPCDHIFCNHCIKGWLQADPRVLEYQISHCAEYLASCSGLENPMVSSCDYVVCIHCSKGWPPVKVTCPVDSRFLALVDMKPTPRHFRNLLNKFEIKCNFGELQPTHVFVSTSKQFFVFRTKRMPDNCFIGTATKSPH